jgi:hypothetical protein
MKEALLESKIVVLSFQRNATQSTFSFLDSCGINGIHHINSKKKSYSFKGYSLDKIKKEIEQYELEFKHFSDAPYFVMYEYFDKKYPNSKFILIIREKNEWLKSFKNLYSKQGVGDPVSFACYQQYIPDIASYNIFKLTDTELIEMYETHNKNIIEYFKDKDNLLIMDINDPQKKEKISSFLNILPQKEFENIDYIRAMKNKKGI